MREGAARGSPRLPTRPPGSGAVQGRKWHPLGKVIEHGLVELPHRAEGEVIEMRAQDFPQRTLTPQLLPDLAEQPAAELLCLVHQEGQHHQHGEHHRKVLLPVPIVVFVVGTPDSSAY